MPRRSPANSNPLDLVLQLVAAFFADGRGGPQKAAKASFVVVALCVVLTGGWWLFQPRERKHEIAQLVGNYSQQHKQIKVTEVIWDIWTQYFHRPFVQTQVATGDGPLLAGEPERTSFPHALRVLYNTAYTVGYCDDLANPAWVGYRVFDMPGHPVPPKRPASFFLDPRTLARVEPGDYTSSGYDRGHMAPNFAIGTRFGAAAQEETFKMSNVCPQRHRLNAGLWKDLEARIADNYTGRYGQVWVIDGPVFGPEDRLARLRNKVPIPQAFYMIVLQKHEGGVRAEGFVIDQEAPGSGSLERYVTSIGEIEHRTGLNFFPKLEREAQKTLEEQSPGAAWRIGENPEACPSFKIEVSCWKRQSHAFPTGLHFLYAIHRRTRSQLLFHDLADRPVSALQPRAAATHGVRSAHRREGGHPDRSARS